MGLGGRQSSKKINGWKYSKRGWSHLEMRKKRVMREREKDRERELKRL